VTQITYYQRWVELQIGFDPFQTSIVYSHRFDVGIQSDGHIWQVDIGAIDYQAGVVTQAVTWTKC
jgi:hypothetical protein